MLALLNPRVWIALAVAALLAASHFGAYRAGRAAVLVDWQAERLVQAEQIQAATDKARKAEQALTTSAANLRSTKDAEIDRLRAGLAAAADSLRNRPERPATDVPATAAAGQPTGCTGAQLYRGDGEFLAGFAADADLLRAELRQCRGQYEAAGKALKPD